MRNIWSLFETAAVIYMKLNFIKNQRQWCNTLKSSSGCLAEFVELFSGSDQKFHSTRIKRGDWCAETHSLSHLYPLELSLTHNYFPDTSADEGPNEDNLVPSKDSKGHNTMKSINKVTSTKSKRKKKSTSNSEYIYY